MSEKVKEKNSFNFYKLFSNISIFLTIGLIAILIMMMTRYIAFSIVKLELVLILLVLSIASSVSLTWIQKIMQNRFKILSWVMIGFVIAFSILWIATIFVVVNFIKKIPTIADEAEAIKMITAFVSYLQFVLIASLQFILGSFVANKVANFGKSNIVLQVLNYLSVVMVDVWLCKLVTIITFKGTEFQLNDTSFLVSRGWWTLLLIAAAVLIVTQASITRIYRRRRREISTRTLAMDAEMSFGEVAEPFQAKETKKAEPTLEEKLKQLKALRDSDMITEEEYQEKRANLLKDI